MRTHTPNRSRRGPWKAIVLLLGILAAAPADATAPYVATGGSSSYALGVDGTVVAWGDNTYGQLGDGTLTRRLFPVKVLNLTNVSALEAGYQHALAVRNGTVWAWGSNDYGQVGDGTVTQRPTPVPLGLTNVAEVSGGLDYSLALKTDGTVWAWGNNTYGKLGGAAAQPQLTPVAVAGFTGVAAIAAGCFHAVALKSDGTVWSQGNNASGQLGNGGLADSSTTVQVQGLTGVRAIAAGHVHTLALKSDGTVWAWGDNFAGQLGDGSQTNRSLPVQVSGLTNVVAIAAGDYNSVAVKQDGTVWAWGENSDYQLGDGTIVDKAVPVRVTGLSGAVGASTGWLHMLALKQDGSIWAWGRNSYGELGNATTTASGSPVAVHGIGNAGTLVLGPASSIQAVAPVVITGPANAQRVTVTATATFPRQAVGRRLFTFAYVPRTLLALLGLVTLDDSDCVLAQITPQGDLTNPGSAGGLDNFGNNVLDSLTQSISMIQNVLISKVKGAKLCVGFGDNGNQATTAGNFSCPASILTDAGAVCQPPSSVGTGTGIDAKTLGARATVSARATLYGGFELAEAGNVFILVRGNSLGTLGVTQNFLDAPRVHLYNSAGQDLLFDTNGAGFNSCVGGSLLAAPVVNYYTNVRGQAPHARDACASQTLPSGAYSFTVTPSSGLSNPGSGQVLFEVIVGGGSSGLSTKTLGSRATVTANDTFYGGFEIASASTVYVLVRGNSLGTLGVTQSFLDAPRVRIYNAQGQDLVSTPGGGPGFNGCQSSKPEQAPVANYYQTVRNQPAQVRDACIGQSLTPGVYSFTVTPSIPNVTSSDAVSTPALGEVLFEVTLK